MEVQFQQIVREKIAVAIDTLPPPLTRRKAKLPPSQGKAMAVIGVRRAGKTSFLRQCRADLIATGRTPGRLLYFNFEDERLAGLAAADLHLIPETLLRMFPEPADDRVDRMRRQIHSKCLAPSRDPVSVGGIALA